MSRSSQLLHAPEGLNAKTEASHLLGQFWERGVFKSQEVRGIRDATRGTSWIAASNTHQGLCPKSGPSDPEIGRVAGFCSGTRSLTHPRDKELIGLNAPHSNLSGWLSGGTHKAMTQVLHHSTLYLRFSLSILKHFRNITEVSFTIPL